MAQNAKIPEEQDKETVNLSGGNGVIQLERVWKIYQMGDVQVPALKGVDLEIE
jgi:hypothetical protein